MFCLQILPATFKLAFAGKRSKLADKLDLSSSGLVSKLLDKRVINRRHSEFVKVFAHFLCDHCCVCVLFYVVL